MVHRLFPPSPRLADLVDCFWVVQDDDPTVVEQKIIPDGYSEIIFHLGDEYEIRLSDTWRRQTRSLVAGQISRHFHLRNRGRSAMVGIMFKPHALTALFGLRMQELTDRVLDLHEVIPGRFDAIERALAAAPDWERRIGVLNRGLFPMRDGAVVSETVAGALRLIFASRGLMPVAEICRRTGVGERALERLFRTHIGLAPKFYSRVIQFSGLFRLVDRRGVDLSELALYAGYYDQPHFNRSFKAFTGEDPSKYGFAKPDMANFFLKRPGDPAR